MINSVLGFMFSHDKTQVALIRKNRPKSQEGKLNGFGGKSLPGEHPNIAMAREFKEEAGIETHGTDWKIVGEFYINSYTCKVFKCEGFVYHVKNECEEGKAEVHFVDELMLRTDLMPNLKWLIQLCLDHDEPYFNVNYD